MLLMGCGAYSQTHEVPFPDSNAVWVQHRAQPVGLPPDYTYNNCYYKVFSHDTTHLNGEIYNNLYFDYYYDPNYNFEVLWEDVYMFEQIGLFRTDSLKVYYKPIPSSVYPPCFVGNSFDNTDPYAEFLLYDFGINVGDTFDVLIDKQIVLETIDSVEINGTYYRKFNFDQPNWYSGGSYHWIEGIGSKLGFFTYFDGFEDYLGFDCFHEDPDSTWITPSFSYAHSNSGCQFAGISESEINNNKELLRITDLMGRECMDKPNTTLIYIYSDGTIEKVYRME